MSALSRLLKSPWRGVVYAAGGSLVLSDIATQPGASSTLIAGTVPYSEQSMRERLGFEPDQHCSALTARNLALQAFVDGSSLIESNEQPKGPESNKPVFGLGITAALKSLRTKLGEHRAYVAVQTAERTIVWHIHFDKGALSREEEERQLANAAFKFLDVALKLTPATDTLEPLADQRFAIEVSALFKQQPHQYGSYDKAVLPGSFNPLHAGHTGMKEAAERLLDTTVSYELSIRNVDKRMLDYIDLAARIDGFEQEPFVLTNQPTFVEKAELLFPANGGTFVVGADTIKRIDHQRYYEDSAKARDLVIARLAELNIRFLVFGRSMNQQGFQTLRSLGIGSDLQMLCDEVAESDFRLDVSSTEIRNQQAGTD